MSERKLYKQTNSKQQQKYYGKEFFSAFSERNFKSLDWETQITMMEARQQQMMTMMMMEEKKRFFHFFCHPDQKR